MKDIWEKHFRDSETEWKIRDLLINVIEDLKKHDMVETKRSKQEHKAINSMLRNASNFTEAVSGVAEALGLTNLPAEHFDQIQTKGWKFALLILMIWHYNIQIENFKNLMIYLLKRDKVNYKTTLGKLIGKITRSSETHGNDLEKRIAVEFRNAFAHSRFWITEHEICYVDDDDFSKCKVIKQTDFIHHARTQNILTKCLGDIINEYYLPNVT
ncbi:MAG: hypothetical protein HY619_02155 [Thaumarchaeota archaeon]|nr:hypothetical protein [Nitrososphaerota archaeon]